MRLDIKVIPGASRDCILGWLGDALKVKVSAPPEKGKANTRVKKMIAAALGLPDKQVSIVKGKTSVRKVIEIDGLNEAEVHQRLSRIID